MAHLNTMDHVRWMLDQLGVRLIKQCARTLRLRSVGNRGDVTARILHMHAGYVDDRERVFAVVRGTYLTMTDRDRASAVRKLDDEFEKVANDGLLVPLELLWPRLSVKFVPTKGKKRVSFG